MKPFAKNIAIGVLLTLLGIVAPTHSFAFDVIDTFAPGDEYNPNGGLLISGANSEFGDIDQAYAFTPTHTGNLTDVWAAIENSTDNQGEPGSNSLVMWLMDDNENKPGNILETFNFENEMAPADSTVDPPLHAVASGTTVLQAGVQYWLVASAGDEDGFAGWTLNTIGARATRADRTNGLDWRVGFNALAGAFRIESDAEGGPIPLDVCPPAPITSDNLTFVLTQDLFVVGGPANCIEVFGADNTIVRLNGYSINGTGGDAGGLGPTGITLSNSNNVLIEGPGAVNNFGRGIGVFGSKNVGIDGLELKDNSRGILVVRHFQSRAAPNDVTITNTKIDQSPIRNNLGGQGIIVFGPNPMPDEVLQNIHLDNVKVENSGDVGIAFRRLSGGFEEASHILVERCKVRKNLRGIDILAGSDVTVRSCEITDNEEEAILVGGVVGETSEVKIRDTLITNNGTGLRITSGGNVQDDVKLRRTCFAANDEDIVNDDAVVIIALDNQFDPPGNCVAAVQLIGTLIDTVIAQDFIHGVENSLLDNLNTALNKLEDENPENDGVAINNLDDFIDTVEAKRGNQISEAQADELVALAEAVIASLEAA